MSTAVGVNPSQIAFRRHDLDALRAVAMVAGIVLHTANAFFSWPAAITVSGASDDRWFDEIYYVIHGFRMPLFFVISGYFSALVVGRYGPALYAKQRTVRILVPLMLFGVVLVPAVNVMSDRFGDPGFVRYPQFSLHHLWFLWVLWLFAIGYAGMSFLGQRFVKSTGDAREGEAPSARLVAIAAGVLVSATAVLHIVNELTIAAALIGPPIQTGLIISDTLLAYYLAFFLFGVVTYRSHFQAGPSYLDCLRSLWAPTLGCTVFFVTPLMFMTSPRAELQGVVTGVIEITYAWGMIIGVTGLFGAILSQERPGIRYLSDASYWLYLIHIPFVLAGQRLVRDLAIPHTVSFLLILGVTIGAALATYAVFVRSTVLGVLLNGRRYPRARPAPQKETRSFVQV